jgi:hypothetical protein
MLARFRQRSNTSKPPSLFAWPFFIDRNIDSPEICAFLEAARFSVQRHERHFAQEEDDDVWIAKVANNNWPILTADAEIEREHLDVVVNSRAKVILLIGKRSGAAQWASSVVVSAEKLVRILEENDGPLILRLGRDGTITKIRPTAEVEVRQRQAETTRIVREKRHR